MENDGVWTAEPMVCGGWIRHVVVRCNGELRLIADLQRAVPNTPAWCELIVGATEYYRSVALLASAEVSRAILIRNIEKRLAKSGNVE